MEDTLDFTASYMPLRDTAYMAIRVSDDMLMYAEFSIRETVRERLARGIRSVTDAPIRFAIVAADRRSWEFRAFAGPDAVKYVRMTQKFRKAGKTLEFNHD